MPESRRRDRTAPDACPGAWRRHDAADGALARFRPVGGALTPAELRVLAGAAVGGGSPLELTSRGSVQVRGLSVRGADDLGDALRGLGGGATALLDGRGRELPCALVASPGGSDAVDAAAGAVAEGLRGRTDVPGRFLVALDDGTGDVAALGADVTVITATGALLLDGVDTGLTAPSAPSAPDPGALAALALAAVDAFTATADGHWRLAEIPGGVAAVASRIPDRAAATSGRASWSTPHDDHDMRTLAPGVGDDGTLTALPRLGEIDLTAAAALIRLLDDTGATLRVTPWRTVVLRGLPDPDAAARTLADAGWETDPGTPWAGLSACVGAPRCAKSHRDVRGELAEAVASGAAGRGRVGAHWVGCHRACGTPGGRVAVVEALAPGPIGPGAYRTVVRSGRTS